MDETLTAHARAVLNDWPLPDSDPRRRSIPHVLAGFLERLPVTLDSTDVENLTQLCLKVNVTGGVREYYKPNWKPPKGAPSLGPRYWRGLLLTFCIGSVSDIPGSDDDDEKGFRLKCLNAAFAAADLLAAGDDVPAVDDLVLWARQRLESELTCPTR